MGYVISFIFKEGLDDDDANLIYCKSAFKCCMHTVRSEPFTKKVHVESFLSIHKALSSMCWMLNLLQNEVMMGFKQNLHLPLCKKGYPYLCDVK
jgi:hypothetical protein